MPLYYDARGDELGVAPGDLNERIAEKLEEFEIDDVDVDQQLERELKRDYHVVTSDRRLDQIARDLVQHYSTAWETGKAMLVCIDKVTCARDARAHRVLLWGTDQGTGDGKNEDNRRAGGSPPRAADRLDAGDARGGGRERGAGRGGEVPQVGA